MSKRAVYEAIICVSTPHLFRSLSYNLRVQVGIQNSCALLAIVYGFILRLEAKHVEKVEDVVC